MTGEQMKSSILGHLQAVMAGDFTKAASFIAEDTVYVEPMGTFKGMEGLKRYMAWNNKTFKDSKFTETGIGTIIQGNNGAVELNLSGNSGGSKVEMPAVFIFEFNNDKIQKIRGYYDRLGAAKQSAKGWLAKWMVNSVIKAAEKGLR